MARARGELAAVAPGPGLLFCLSHGVELRSNGWCSVGNAYATNAACPFSCPICRAPLDWVGGCARCHGCTTGDRRDWTFPGARYERDADNPGHYKLVAEPGRRSCMPLENAAAMQRVRAILTKALAR